MRKGFLKAPVTVVSRSKSSLTLTQHGTSTNNQSTVSTNNGTRKIPALPKNGRKMESVGTSTSIKKISLRGLAEAVAKQEGFYNPEGSVAKRNNSPCNLTNKGDLGKSGRFAKWSTVEKGFGSCEKSLKRYIKQGKTLNQLIRIWSPEGDGANNPTEATNNIARWMGINKNIKLNLIIK